MFECETEGLIYKVGLRPISLRFWVKLGSTVILKPMGNMREDEAAEEENQEECSPLQGSGRCPEG